MAAVKPNVSVSDSDSSSVYSDFDRENADQVESDDESLPGSSDSDADGLLGPDQSLLMGLKDPEGDFDHYDSSDEEDLRNTIGNIPVQWYDNYDHIGYDWTGKTIQKPPKLDEIQRFMARMDDPDFWRKVRDKQLGVAEQTLSDTDVGIIANLEANRFPEVGYNPYQPFVDLFSSEVMEHPVSNRPEHKRSFIPSKLEKEKVSRMVHAIKMGWIKPRKPKKTDEEDAGPTYYNLWANEGDQDDLTKSQMARLKMRIPPPKLKLPGHEESYNPPAEYLFTDKEKEQWESQESETRKLDFVPLKYDCLRHVPGYSQFIQERYQRMLDLFLAPRKRIMKLNVNPEDLLPKLPKPEELRPFPSMLAITYKGHGDVIRCLTTDRTGQYMASGCDDNTVKFWEIATGRCLQTVSLPGPCVYLAWCPRESMNVVAAAVGSELYIISPRVWSKHIVSDTDKLLGMLNTQLEQRDKTEGDGLPGVVWNWCDTVQQKDGLRFRISHPKPVKQVSWHSKGDYMAVAVPDGGSNCVYFHQLSKLKSQTPFSKNKGRVSHVYFHPREPLFFVATQKFVRIYNLVKKQQTKKLLANCQFISSLAIHPHGDHLIMGSFDHKLSWFDLDLSMKPFQTLRYHKQAIRAVAYHDRYPLFASCSDDGSTIISHGKVYSDFQNALIVPLKVLRGHTGNGKSGLSVTYCTFHPAQPWVFTAGADGLIKLFV